VDILKGKPYMYKPIDDSPSKFVRFRNAVIKELLNSYVVSEEEVEQLLHGELDLLYDLFDDGSVEGAAAVLAVLNDLADK
jgi:hypothetical protein